MNVKIVVVLILLLVYYYELIKINLMVFLIISRGIISPNEFWWKMSDLLLNDGSGIKMYRQLKNKSNRKIVPLNFFGNKTHCLMDQGFIKQVLDQSPSIFGVGSLKYNFFSSFMSMNVGVSNGIEWIQRRKLNEQVLENDKLANNYYLLIGDLINQFGVPKQPTDFSHLAQHVAMKIVFGADNIKPEVFQVFGEANSIFALWGMNISDSPNVQNYQQYLKQNIHHPIHNSLVEIATRYETNEEELIHQIPHWIFPIIGQVSTTVPRVLLLLFHHPQKLNKLLNILRNHNLDAIQQLYQIPYLRYCVLETLRLNNPVVTTFRTLLSDYTFEDEYSYKKGDLFLILNNPVLREQDFWPQADQFIPERWEEPGLEKSYYAIMFNQGPQKCPGKELALIIIQSCLVQILIQSGLISGEQTLKKAVPQINPLEIEQMINPFTIEFEY